MYSYVWNCILLKPQRSCEHTPPVRCKQDHLQVSPKALAHKTHNMMSDVRLLELPPLNLYFNEPMSALILKHISI